MNYTDFAFVFHLCRHYFCGRAVLENLIEKQFPAPSRFFAFGKEDKKKNTKKHKPDSSGPATERNSSLKRKLSEPMEIVGRRRNSSKKLCVLYSDDDSDDENIQMDVNSGADANSVNGKIFVHFVHLLNFHFVVYKK